MPPRRLVSAEKARVAARLRAEGVAIHAIAAQIGESPYVTRMLLTDLGLHKAQIRSANRITATAEIEDTGPRAPRFRRAAMQPQEDWIAAPDGSSATGASNPVALAPNAAQLYLSGLSLVAVGKLLGVSAGTARSAVLLAGVQIRPRGRHK